MKKRIISALLAILMVIGCFGLTACNKEEEEDEVTNIGQRVATTLTMWLPAAEGSKIDDESVAQVEKAINEITQAKFSTAIKFKVFESSEYDALVEAQIADCTRRKEQAEEEAAKKREEQREAAAKGEKVTTSANTPAETTAPDTKAVEAENQFSAMNAAIFASYPAIEPAQFDIFVIRGADQYKKYVDAYALASLTENLKDDSKELYSYIYPTFFESVLYQGETYAVPNNRGIGEYEIMLVNKKIAEDLYYDPAQLNSVQKLFTYDNSGISFIEDVMASYPDVVPVAGTYSAPYVKYWNSANNGEFSILSSLVSSEMNIADITIVNTLKNVNYVNYITYSKRINEIVTPEAFDKDKNFAVGFTKATAEDIANYSKDYQVTVLQNPQPTQAETMESMFAVSVHTKDVDRSMEIITLLNTDTELRTLLQYGVEGVHWKKDVDDNSVMHIINDKYKMNINETGNVYMTYPADGVPMTYWEHDKKQNLDSFLPYTNGFVYNNEYTQALLTELDKFSDDIEARIAAMTSAEFTASLDDLRNEIDNLDCVKKLTYYPSDDEEGIGYKIEESIAFAWFEYMNQD